jgi:hypothetical protein
MRKLTNFIPERTRSTEPKTKPVGIRLHPEYIEVLDKMATEFDTSRRGVIQAMVEREAIAMGLMEKS